MTVLSGDVGPEQRVLVGMGDLVRSLVRIAGRSKRPGVTLYEGEEVGQLDQLCLNTGRCADALERIAKAQEAVASVWPVGPTGALSVRLMDDREDSVSPVDEKEAYDWVAVCVGADPASIAMGEEGRDYAPLRSGVEVPPKVDRVLRARYGAGLRDLMARPAMY